jgi:hypothetical protein
MAECDTKTWLDASFDLAQFAESDRRHEATVETTMSSGIKLSTLCLDLSSYLYFLVTMLQFFSVSFEVSKLRSAEERWLDNLATARQLLGTNSNLARSIITQFRQANGL